MENETTEIIKHSSCNKDQMLGKKMNRDDIDKKNHKNHKPGKFCKYSKKWIPYKHLTYEDKKKLIDIASFKDHQKQASFYFNKKEFKGSNENQGRNNSYQTQVKVKPPTPHNTSQYLTSNFAEDKAELVSTNESIKYLRDDSDLDMYGHDFGVENICVTGGSMKGMINLSNYLGTLGNLGLLGTLEDLGNLGKLGSLDNLGIFDDSNIENTFTERKQSDIKSIPEAPQSNTNNLPKFNSNITINTEKLDKLFYSDNQIHIPMKAEVNISQISTITPTNQTCATTSNPDKTILIMINCLTSQDIHNLKDDTFYKTIEQIYDRLNQKDEIYILSCTNTDTIVTNYSSKEQTNRNEFRSKVLVNTALDKSEYENKIKDKLMNITIDLLTKLFKLEESDKNERNDTKNRHMSKLISGKEKYNIIFLSNESQSPLQERVKTALNKVNLNKHFNLTNLSFGLGLRNKNLIFPFTGIIDETIDNDNYTEIVDNILQKYYIFKICSQKSIGKDYLELKIKLLRNSKEIKENSNVLRYKFKDEKESKEDIQCEETRVNSQDDLNNEILHIELKFKDLEEVFIKDWKCNNNPYTELDSQYFTIILPLQTSPDEPEVKTFITNSHIPNTKQLLEYEFSLHISNLQNIDLLNEFSLFYKFEYISKQPPNNLKLHSDDKYLHLKDLCIKDQLSNNKITQNTDIDCVSKITNLFNNIQESSNFINYLSGKDSTETLLKELNMMISQVNNLKNKIENKTSQ